MRTARYGPEALVPLLRQRKIATMGDLKEALGTAADATVFRKLSELEYAPGYSHRGRYYTLDELALGMVLIGQDERLREAIRRQLATARRATSRRREPAG